MLLLILATPVIQLTALKICNFFVLLFTISVNNTILFSISDILIFFNCYL